MGIALLAVTEPGQLAGALFEAIAAIDDVGVVSQIVADGRGHRMITCAGDGATVISLRREPIARPWAGRRPATTGVVDPADLPRPDRPARDGRRLTWLRLTGVEPETWFEVIGPASGSAVEDLLAELEPFLATAWRRALAEAGPRLVVEAVGLAAVLVDDGDVIRYASPAAEELLDGSLGPGSAIGRILPTVAPPNVRSTTVRLDADDVGVARLVILEGAADPTLIGSVGERLGLTPRQTEVLARVSTGSSDREVAGILGISVQTVRKHLDAIFRRLGVENRTQASSAYRDVSGPATPPTG